MFLRRKITPQNGKKYEYYVIVEKYKIDDKIKEREIIRVGKLTPEQLENVKRWLSLNPGKKENLEKKIITLEDTERRETRLHGEIMLGHILWKQFGLHNIIIEALNGVKNKLENAKLIEIMVIDRLIQPMSKYALLDWLPKTTFPFILNINVEKLHENKFYKTMDRLWKKKDKIEKMIYERIVAPTMSSEKVIMKDITSTLFYGDGPEHAAYGYSREHRSDCKQICWGLIVTEEGLPVTLEVYPGNTPDETTVKKSIERTKFTFGIEEGIFVGDRGLKNINNVKEIKEQGYRYILAETNREVKEIIEKGLKRELVKVEEGKKYYNQNGEYIGNEATEITIDGVRYIVVRNKGKEKEERKIIEDRLKEGKRLLKESGAIEVEEGVFRQGVRERKGKKDKLSKMETERIRISHNKLMSLREKLKEFGANRYYHAELNHGNEQLVYWKKKRKIEEYIKYSGIWVLSTDTDSKIKDCVRIYKMLSQIENAFRTIKSKLKVRPVRHYKKNRPDTHVFICDLAYLLSRLIELKLEKKKIETSWERIFGEFINVTLEKQGIPETNIEMWKEPPLNKTQKKLLSELEIDSKIYMRGWNKL